MRSPCTYLWVVLAVLVAAPVRGQDQEKPTRPLRIALISADRGEELAKVLTLAEARLTDLPGLEVLERAAIDRVLAEQKLTLSGLVAADQAVKIGKLLTVDLFAVLDAEADTKKVGGLVVFDAHTGVRLWDAGLPDGGLEASVQGLVRAVAAAVRKQRRTEKLRPVCLLTVRNVDLPRDMDAFCDSVGLLLERRLVASPDLAVLERRWLNQVNRERDLPTGSPLRQLLASVVTVELEVGRSAEKNGLRATALLSDAQGKSLGKVTVTVGKQDADALAAALFRAQAETLHVKLAPGEPQAKREAARFLREAEFFWAHKDPLRALPAIESAFALSPEDASLRVAVARGLLAAANEVLDPGGRLGVGAFVHKVDPEKLERSLNLARAGSERLVEVEALPEEVRLTPAGNVHKMLAASELHTFLQRVGGVTEDVPAAARTVIGTVQANQRRLFDVHLRRAAAAVVDRASFDRYSTAVSGSLFELFNPGVSAEKWVEGLEQLRPWAEVARKHEDVRASSSRSLLSRALFSYRYPRQVNESQIVRLRKLWSELEEHPNRTIAVYGRLGAVATEVTFGKLSDDQRRARVRDYRLFVQGHLEKTAREPDAFRLNLYLAAADGIDLLINRPGHREELKDLTEFMLARKELAPTVAQITAFSFQARRTAEDSRYAYGVLRRALAIVDGKEGRFLSFAESPMVLRFDRDRFRKEYRSRQDDLIQADPSVAGDLLVSLPDTQTLLDVHPKEEGIVWLQQPIVDQGVVNVAAVEVQGTPPRHSVLLVRLTPGQGGRWEGRKVAVSLRYQPWTGTKDNRFRLGITFGTCACVHDGRYYLGTRGHGIFAFPFDGGEPERITTAEGLPSDSVQGLACLDGRLYAYLGEGNKDAYVVAWDLRKRKCEVLASSRRKDKRSPFDDSSPLTSSFFQADPRRGQIVFSAFSPFTQMPLNGLWALDGKTGTFKRLFVLHHTDIALVGPSARLEGDVIRMPSRIGVFQFDLAKNDGDLLYAGKVRLEVGPTRSAVFKVSQMPAYRQWTDSTWNASPPFAVGGGWLWAAKPFSRRPLDGGPPQLLAPLRPGQKFFQPTECLQPFDERRLLVGDSFGLWLVPLSEKEKDRDRETKTP
jgi:hypothetical protein